MLQMFAVTWLGQSESLPTVASAQLKSSAQQPEQSEREIKAQFDAHECKPQESSPNESKVDAEGRLSGVIPRGGRWSNTPRRAG